MKTILITLTCLLLTCGCTTQKNLTNLVKALAKDPATVRFSYGPLIFERFVPQAGNNNLVAMPGQWPFLMPQAPMTVTPLTAAPGYFWTPSTNVVK